jgi:formylglycine-generating enzyme required for sulfatase activity
MAHEAVRPSILFLSNEDNQETCMVHQQRNTAALLIVFVILSILHQSAAAVTIDMVTVGNPGNSPDTEVMQFDGTTGYGAVDYVYRIGKFEITAGQYTEFLNAVAREDTHRLYSSFMNAGDFPADIERHGSAGSYTYTVAADWSSRPVNFVSFWDSLRFANWLHNKQPTTGVQDSTTTEDGAYELNGYTGTDGAWITRKPGARFVIPSEDEWYKAAYHKNDGVTGNYWDFPTQCDTEPVNSLPDSGNHANLYDYSGTGTGTYAIGPPYYRTEVGAYENSPGPYGTFDQAGNVYEWNEAIVDPERNHRGIRGDSFYEFVTGRSHASARIREFPWAEAHGTGFRIASSIPEPAAILQLGIASLMIVSRRRRPSIPEPSTLLLLCLGSLAVLWRRRRGVKKGTFYFLANRIAVGTGIAARPPGPVRNLVSASRNR